MAMNIFLTCSPEDKPKKKTHQYTEIWWDDGVTIVEANKKPNDSQIKATRNHKYQQVGSLVLSVRQKYDIPNARAMKTYRIDGKYGRY